jgi:tetratricopeptide (TPR) repeat protein
MKQHYQTVSKEFGYKVSPPEMMINGLGYNALSLKQYAKAAALFEMNMENYPENGNVYDSFADVLVAQKDTIKAIANYQKAFAITKSEETKQKIDQLQGKAVFILTAKELEKYVAAFEFETISLTATTSIKNNALWIFAPGQGEYELVPLSSNVFTIKGLQGYKIQFEMDGDKPLGLTSTQPNGTFKAHVKK